MLASVTVQIDLCLTWSQTLKTGFLVTRLNTFSTLPCFPLPPWNLQTPCLSIPWCYLPITSSVSLLLLAPSLSSAELSWLTRLWHLSPSVNSIFKHACAAIQWGYMSDIWLDPMSTSIHYVCEQQMLWMRSLAWAFAVRLWYKYHNLMSWLSWLRHTRGSWYVAIPSEFRFLYHGQEIIMHSSGFLDHSVANLLVPHIVFVGNVQKSPIASHLEGLDPSLEFCSQGSAFTGIKEGGLASVSA